MLMRPDRRAIEQIVQLALQEDAPWGDITSEALLSPNLRVAAQLRAREDGILCGEDLFMAAMRSDLCVKVEFFKHDSEIFRKGETIAAVEGPARTILRAERVALNFVQRLSGIATTTAKYVAETAETKARIVDTRKTTPGLRLFERYAVRCGGGHNHRFSLSDALMAKDNHIAALNSTGAADLTAKLRSAFANLPHTTTIEVEVDSLEQIEPVIAAGVDVIMLDNFSINDLKAGVLQVAGRALVEASGGVTLDRVREIAATGVDIISVGALTHSVQALDLGLDIE
jgi:nicotinate-nucleotide pyrophosphorylase (carboxylating)